MSYLTGLGTIVIDEQIFPITGIRLADGKILFEVGLLPLPVHLPQTSEVRIHAPDGSLVAVGPWKITEREARELSTMLPGGVASIVWPIHIEKIAGWPTVST